MGVNLVASGWLGGGRGCVGGVGGVRGVVEGREDGSDARRWQMMLSSGKVDISLLQYHQAQSPTGAPSAFG